MKCPHCQGTGQISVFGELENRENKFVLDTLLIQDRLKIHSKIINEFIDYWTEPNRSKTKMRFEMQTTWDLKKRLQRFIRNDEKWNKKGEIKPHDAIKMPAGYGKKDSSYWKTRSSNHEPKKISELIKK